MPFHGLPSRLPFLWVSEDWNGFSWTMTDDKFVVRMCSIDGNCADYDLYPLKEALDVEDTEDENLRREVITVWEANGPTDTLPDFCAIDEEEEFYFFFTRTGPLVYSVHCFDTGQLSEEESMEEAGTISAPLSKGWRKLCMYAIFVGFLLVRFPFVSEKCYRPGGSGALECSKRFKSMIG